VPKNFDASLHIALGDFTSGRTVSQLRLPSSKTDTDRRGVRIPLGKASGPVCAVKAIALYQRRLPREAAETTGPLFVFEDGKPMTAAWFSGRLQEQCRRHGYFGRVSPHSLRIGAATTAARVGVPDHLIKLLGRWKSDCFQRYLRVQPDELARTVATVADAGSEETATGRRHVMP
jgi:site-specific recombinase XerD